MHCLLSGSLGATSLLAFAYYQHLHCFGYLPSGWTSTWSTSNRFLGESFSIFCSLSLPLPEKTCAPLLWSWGWGQRSYFSWRDISALCISHSFMCFNPRSHWELGQVLETACLDDHNVFHCTLFLKFIELISSTWIFKSKLMDMKPDCFS